MILHDVYSIYTKNNGMKKTWRRKRRVGPRTRVRKPRFEVTATDARNGLWYESSPQLPSAYQLRTVVGRNNPSRNRT